MESFEKLKSTLEAQSIEIELMCNTVKEIIQNLLREPMISAPENDSDVSNFKNNIYDYEFLFEIKSFAVYLRDICMNTYKYQQQFKDNLISEGNFNSYKLEVNKSLDTIASQLFLTLSSIKNVSQVDLKKIKIFNDLQNPRPKLLEQINEVEEQITLINLSAGKFKELRIELMDYKQWVTNTVNIFNNSLNQIVNKTGEIYNEIKLIKSKTDLEPILFKQINQYFNKGFSEIETDKLHYPIPDYIVNTGKKIRIPISTSATNVVVKEIDFEKQLISWEESEIYPIILELQEMITMHMEHALSYFLNGINLLMFISSSPSHSTIETINTSNLTIYNECIEIQDYLSKKQEIIQMLISENLVLSNIFDQKQLFFKSTRGQHGQFDRGKEFPIFKRISSLKIFQKDSYDRVLNNLNITNIGSNNGSLSHVVDFVEQQSTEITEGLTHSLFFTKGFLGATFMISRLDFDELYTNSLDKWYKGYTASMLISGTRLSGKSALVEAISAKEQNIVTLSIKPNSKIKLRGQHFETTSNLSKAISDVVKINRHHKLILIIDDFELWRSQTITIMDNAHYLQSAIHKHSKRFFFIVTMGQQLKASLDQFLNLSQLFVHHYQADYMLANEIKEAILIRQGVHALSKASINQNQFNKLIRKLITRHNNNIGTCLRTWYSIINDESKNKYLENVNQGFLHLIHDQNHVLRHILKLKHTNEFELKSMSGNLNSKSIDQGIQILLGTGILKRELISNNLVFNEHIINDIETNLESHA